MTEQEERDETVEMAVGIVLVTALFALGFWCFNAVFG